ncbi:WD40 repeat-like protein [Rickenella mellea]|uniref:DNA damage-binding protein CMR1 n=1 Tax=Rickenella mellea TaxID=50990 RepID=A0A4Y7QC15_9AGAM|nr:WD40 repeat-like protein [Rickenella mellea]
MPKLSEYELERQANIAKNRALLEELDLTGVAAKLGLPSGSSKNTAKEKSKAKPVQPAKKVKRERDEVVAPRRQSSRLKREVVDPDESPSKRRKREEEAKAQRQKEEEARLEAEERAREARRPRHYDLDLQTLGDEMSTEEMSGLKDCFDLLAANPNARRVGKLSDFVFDDDKREKAEVTQLRESFSKLKVVSRAKVTQDRIYSAAYHPEKTKDLIFFGDKHGQLGIWDARAPQDDVEDEDGQLVSPDEREGGKYWRLQPHWPATSKSSVSTVKFDPIDAHSVFTSAYDCTIRCLSLTSGISREIYATDDILISSLDLPPTGQEMWVSDADGGLTHLDLREGKSRTRRWELSQQKIGCVSINPTFPTTLLTASNDRTLKVWDARKLQEMPLTELAPGSTTPSPSARRVGSDKPLTSDMPILSDFGAVEEFKSSKKGSGTLRCQYPHDKSVSSAYWDPRGRNIVSTSYDDNLRIWDIGAKLTSTLSGPFKPFARMHHNCQTGKWLTILKAQWSPNSDVFPHFTIGNMNHSLDIITCNGEHVGRLSDRERITAVQAVTCSHPGVVQRVASGNASGRCVLWAPEC